LPSFLWACSFLLLSSFSFFDFFQTLSLSMSRSSVLALVGIADELGRASLSRATTTASLPPSPSPSPLWSPLPESSSSSRSSTRLLLLTVSAVEMSRNAERRLPCFHPSLILIIVIIKIH
jgi:hypothetical protein